MSYGFRQFLGVLVLLLSNGAAQADLPAVHGMVLFGGQTLYASHLPMFHSPHDRQLILQVGLVDQTGNSTVARFNEARAAGVALFTLEPEVMDLESVAAGLRNSFRAILHQGHFERGSTRLGTVEIQVQKIILSTRLNAGAPATPARYLVFGGAGGYFAVHLIQGRPSFDVILEVSRPYISQELDCRRICRDRKVPLPDSRLPLVLSGPNEPSGLAGAELGDPFGAGMTHSQRVLYLEIGDLSH